MPSERPATYLDGALRAVPALIAVPVAAESVGRAALVVDERHPVGVDSACVRIGVIHFASLAF